MEKLAITAGDLKSFEGITAGNLSSSKIGNLISVTIPYLFTAAGIILLLYLISSGFSFLTSAGDPKKIEAAKSKITSALIGFFIVFLSYIIVRIIALFLSAQPVLDIF